MFYLNIAWKILKIGLRNIFTKESQLLWKVSLYFWRQMGYSIIQTYSLNPQPKELIFKTMIVAIVFPLRLLWVMWPFTANQLLACFPLQLLWIKCSLLIGILCCRDCYIGCFIVLLALILGSMNQACHLLVSHGFLTILLSILNLQFFFLYTCLFTVIHWILNKHGADAKWGLRLSIWLKSEPDLTFWRRANNCSLRLLLCRVRMTRSRKKL